MEYQIENNRKKDMFVEREIASFLDEHLYSNKTIFANIKRTDDYNSQMNGSDVVLNTSDSVLKDVVADEKVAARYANTNLQTFSLELSFLRKGGKKTCGWFLDKHKKTQYYLFGWVVHADIEFDQLKERYNTDSITKDKIKEFDWALVSRDKIFKFLEEKGWTLEKLEKQDELIRQRGFVKTKSFVNDVAFRYSQRYVEQPINILLKKETYVNLSDYHGKIMI